MRLKMSESAAKAQIEIEMKTKQQILTFIKEKKNIAG